MVTCSGSVIPQTRKTDLRNDRVYFLVYKTILYLLFRSVGPLVALVYLNGRLVRALQAVRARRHNRASGGRRRDAKHGENLTVMLLSVVSVFIVCQLPDLGIRVAFTCAEFSSSTASKRGLLDVEALRYANAMSNALLTLNSSVNFFVYCLVGRKFRRILLRDVCRMPMASTAATIGRQQQVHDRQVVGDTSETELTPHCHPHQQQHQLQQQHRPGSSVMIIQDHS